ncbi:MAG: hypothetical protein EU981_04730 [Candidatus Liberibacter ctenarytainae]|uniref:Uncharacterized protein n=1 Tax=Candidatus Liberibacter ctenarytainae TaxID=2020335 RepID=A0A937DM89_9HYPH|nr:hypothetical protein [Candidatus Liberibacter ctenarytainae]
MKSQAQKTHLKESHAHDKQRQLNQLRSTIVEFKRMVDNLEKQIAVEERKSGIYDQNHFEYPIFAQSARQRVDNLLVSIRELLLLQENLESNVEKVDSKIDKNNPMKDNDIKNGIGI